MTGDRPRVAFVAADLSYESPAGSTMVALVARAAETAEVHVFSSRLDPSLVSRVTFHRIDSGTGSGMLAQLLRFLRGERTARRRAAGAGIRFDAVWAVESESSGADILCFHNCHRQALGLTLRRRLWSPGVSLASAAVMVSNILILIVRTRVERRAARGARRFIALTEFQRDLLVRHYALPAERIAVVPNAVQERPGAAVPRDEARRILGLADDEVGVVFVAQGGWKRKGLDLIIRAIARADRRVVLRVVGGGSSGEQRAFGNLAARLGAAGRVRFVGPRADAGAIIGGADVFALASWYEAFSLVSLEALAAGLPMVMTPISGAADVIEQERNGYIVEQSSEAWARRFDVLAADPALRARMGARSREIARRFSPRSVLDAQFDVLSDVLRERGFLGPEQSVLSAPARLPAASTWSS